HPQVGADTVITVGTAGTITLIGVSRMPFRNCRMYVLIGSPCSEGHAKKGHQRSSSVRLRQYCLWPGRRAAEQRDELAPFHSLPSSARASSLSGSSGPVPWWS